MWLCALEKKSPIELFFNLISLLFVLSLFDAFLSLYGFSSIDYSVHSPLLSYWVGLSLR